MILKIGSKGEEVKSLQRLLGLKDDGEFGPKTEEAVKEYQKKHNLTPDGIVGQQTWNLLQESSDNLCITNKFINKHITHSPNRPIKYLVIHYTAGCNSRSGAAMNARNVFLNCSASADFCVDDNTIIQVNPDLKNYYCWAVGDGKGKYGISNKNCISIEICSNIKKGTSVNTPNHDGWYFTDKSLNNAIKLSKYLIKKYNISPENIVRHYDASRKLCPGIIGWNDGELYNPITGKKIPNSKNNSNEWGEFKNKIIS